MILGAGAAQVPLIQAAQAMGYEAIAATVDGPYPGIRAADAVTYTDITDCEAVARAAAAYGVSAVATCCLETGVMALAYTCEKLGFPGPSLSAAEISVNKLAMQRAFAAGGVKAAAFRELRSHADLDAAIDAIGFPLVVKAVDLQGSKGVYVTRGAAEAHNALDSVLSLTKEEYCLAEEFIAGRSFCAEAFVQNGDIFFVLPDGNITISNPGLPDIPIGHYMPFDCPADVRAGIVREVEKAIRACGIDNCAVNLDMILRDGEPYVIELTARAGATCLSELISIYYGVDYYRMILMAALGMDARPYFDGRRPETQPTAATMLTAEKSGIVRSIRMPETLPDTVHDLHLIVGEGDAVRKFTSAGDRIGQLIVSGPSVPDCLDLIEQTLSKLHIEVDE